MFTVCWRRYKVLLLLSVMLVGAGFFLWPLLPFQDFITLPRFDDLLTPATPPPPAPTPPPIRVSRVFHLGDESRLKALANARDENLTAMTNAEYAAILIAPHYNPKNTPFQQAKSVVREVQKLYFKDESYYYGDEYINAVRRNKESICWSDPQNPNATSRFSCHYSSKPPGTNSFYETLNYCVYHDVMIPHKRAPTFLDVPSPVAGCVPIALNTSRSEHRKVRPMRCGLLQKNDVQPKSNFCPANAGSPDNPSFKRSQCKLYIENPVIIHTRTSNHIYHSIIQDFYAEVYLSLFAADIDPNASQLIVVSGCCHDDGKYLSTIRGADDHMPVVDTVHDFFFKTMFGPKPFPYSKLENDTCFKTAIIPHATSFLDFYYYERISVNALLYGYRRWALASMDLHHSGLSRRIVFPSRWALDVKSWLPQEMFLSHDIAARLPPGWKFELWYPMGRDPVPANETKDGVALEAIPPMGFQEQLRYIYNASILLAPHGSHMTHILFMQPQTFLVEIQYNDRRWTAFRDLAFQLGLDFLMLDSRDPKVDMYEEIMAALLKAIAKIETTFKDAR